MRKPVSNTQALLNARLWLKGLHDALSILGVKPTVVTNQGPGALIHVVEVAYTINGIRYFAKSNVDAKHLEVMEVGYYAYGKMLGRELLNELAEGVCEAQPQEITIGLKELDKAQTKDRSTEASVQAIRDFAVALTKMSTAGVPEAFKGIQKRTNWAAGRFPNENDF